MGEMPVLFYIGFIVVFIVLLFIAKWIFRIEDIIMEQKARRKLLSMIAEKIGIDGNSIKRVNDIADGKTTAAIQKILDEKTAG